MRQDSVHLSIASHSVPNPPAPAVVSVETPKQCGGRQGVVSTSPGATFITEVDVNYLQCKVSIYKDRETMKISRRIIQSVLGALWFVDGLLQLKPQMFTKSWIEQVILPTTQGQPTWVSSLINWGAHWVTPHIAPWNLIFALVQIAIGLGLLFSVAVKTTLVWSFIWTLMVWVFGEGVGQILTGQSLLLTGAPGAVLLYGFIGAAAWPKDGNAPQEWQESGIKFARYALGLLWVLGCVLHFQGAYLTPKGFSQAISLHWLSTIVGTNGLVVSIVLGVIEGLIGIILLANYRVRVTIWVSTVLSLIFWWVGQSFGQLFQPLATDFNTGLVMIVLSFCAYPSLWCLTKHRRT